MQRVRVSSQPYGFWPAVWFGLVDYPGKNANRCVLAGVLPGPDQNPVCVYGVGTGTRVHFAVPTFLCPIKYLSYNHIMT
jgi:hypothetical protein